MKFYNAGEVPYTELTTKKYKHGAQDIPSAFLGKKIELPEPLNRLSEKNQVIFCKVVAICPDQRLTAKEWLEELESYEI